MRFPFSPLGTCAALALQPHVTPLNTDSTRKRDPVEIGDGARFMPAKMMIFAPQNSREG
jgi:hypothetical protein